MSDDPTQRDEAAPTVEALLLANLRFYETFSRLNYPAMERLWEKTDRVFCVHPGWQALRGWMPVLDSWKRIIANTASISFTLTSVTGHVDGEIGVVTMYENIASRVGHERHTSSTVSTNLFGYDEEHGWRIFHHHSAHVALPGEADDTLLN
jgi:ketosteroid isomerase-like protein